MTKAELIDRIARNRDLPPEVTKKIIAAILDITFAELAAYFVRSRLTRSSNPRFTFPKFGTFTKKKRNGRRGVNPRTLEPMEIEACETIDFKPSAELKRMVNEAGVPLPKSASKSAGKTRKGSRATSKRARPAGPGGRLLLTREEAELELPGTQSLLPAAPLQRVGRRTKAGKGSKAGKAGARAKSRKIGKKDETG